MVRPHLEYANVIWSPHLKRQSAAIEKVQRRATKLLPAVREWSYESRLHFFKLPSLKYRRFRGDCIQTFKILNKTDNLNIDDFFDFYVNSCTRDQDVKILVKRCNTNIKSNSFSFRATKYWNALKPTTRRAPSLNLFKQRLDHWMRTLTNS
jgi:hypothetical protein